MEVHLPHPVGVGLTYRAQLTIEVNLKQIVWVWTKDDAYFDLEIEVTDVARVWLHAEDTSHFITLLAGEIVVQVEYCLLPVSVPNVL